MGSRLCGRGGCYWSIIISYGVVLDDTITNQDAGVSGYMAHNHVGSGAGCYRRFTDEIK